MPSKTSGGLPEHKLEWPRSDYAAKRFNRLKGWMFSFKGVATKYLDNYLGWHRLLDKTNHRMQGRKFYLFAKGQMENQSLQIICLPFC